MKHRHILTAWGRILRGYKPLLSVEITKECPLRCPGCYAYQDAHLNNGSTLRQLSDYRGDDLINAVTALVRRTRPVHISIVGGEPLVRYRELGVLIPKINKMGVEVQLVTSAVRRIPPEWTEFDDLHLVVSIDGLREEHDVRRAPATYDRILENIKGHDIIVHCTITHQQMQRDGYLREFTEFWSGQSEARKIWFSLFTPQIGEVCEERLNPDDRKRVVEELTALRLEFPKIYAPGVVLGGYITPPPSPADCIFAQTTTCYSSDLRTPVTPCQLGGQPDCSQCGCIASAGLASIGNYKLAGLVNVSAVFNASKRLGERLNPHSAAPEPLTVIE